MIFSLHTGHHHRNDHHIYGRCSHVQVLWREGEMLEQILTHFCYTGTASAIISQIIIIAIR